MVSPHDVVANVLDCDIMVRVFELQSCYYVHFQANTFGTGMKPYILPPMGLIVLLLSFNKDGLGIW